jgi:hypothetical protein
MKKLILGFALIAFVGTINAQQSKGDWFIGGSMDAATGSWSDWSLAPNVGICVADNWAIGGSFDLVSGGASDAMSLDVWTRYFFGGLYASAGFGMGLADGLDASTSVGVGLGKMFYWGDHLYIDPNLGFTMDHDGTDATKALTLGIGLGLKF